MRAKFEFILFLKYHKSGIIQVKVKIIWGSFSKKNIKIYGENFNQSKRQKNDFTWQ